MRFLLTQNSLSAFAGLPRLSQLEVWTLDKSLKINATIKKVCTKLAISTQAASG
jgi:hypothetical protein